MSAYIERRRGSRSGFVPDWQNLAAAAGCYMILAALAIGVIAVAVCGWRPPL